MELAGFRFFILSNSGKTMKENTLLRPKYNMNLTKCQIKFQVFFILLANVERCSYKLYMQTLTHPISTCRKHAVNTMFCETACNHLKGAVSPFVHLFCA